MQIHSQVHQTTQHFLFLQVQRHTSKGLLGHHLKGPQRSAVMPKGLQRPKGGPSGCRESCQRPQRKMETQGSIRHCLQQGGCGGPQELQPVKMCMKRHANPLPRLHQTTQHFLFLQVQRHTSKGLLGHHLKGPQRSAVMRKGLQRPKGGPSGCRESCQRPQRNFTRHHSALSRSNHFQRRWWQLCEGWQGSNFLEIRFQRSSVTNSHFPKQLLNWAAFPVIEHCPSSSEAAWCDRKLTLHCQSWKKKVPSPTKSWSAAMV